MIPYFGEDMTRTIVEYWLQLQSRYCSINLNGPSQTLTSANTRLVKMEKGNMKPSEIHQFRQTLRFHMLAMCRLSQRCVDYSIKALQMGRPAFCANVFENTYEMNVRHHDAMEIAQDLLLTGLSSDSDLRFASASMRICDVLQAVYITTSEIAEASSLLLKEDEEIDCAELTAMGDLANRLMRLCTVALFEEEIEHAEAALRMKTGERLVATSFYLWYRRISLKSPSIAECALSITDRLDQLIFHVHEMARAIVFWLEDREHDPLPEPYAPHLLLA